ncbi:hypothetical protein EDD15DRAFT_389343 [Pisolithus albus]|nr:hypothetical protein EDD15DRAFT_389343 [Pisolithus albus]
MIWWLKDMLYTLPYKNYKSFPFTRALFALVVPKLETINTLFTSTCRDVCRAIHDQWNDFIRCIETGVISDLKGIDQVKDNFQIRQLELVQILITMLKPSNPPPPQRFLQPNSDGTAQDRKGCRNAGWLRQIRPEPHSLLLQNM